MNSLTGNRFWAILWKNTKEGIISGVLGGILGGLVYALIEAVILSFYKPTLLLTALAYYPLYGIRYGIVFGVIISLLYIFFPKRSKIKYLNEILFISIAIMPLGPQLSIILRRTSLNLGQLSITGIISYTLIFAILWFFYLLVIFFLKRLGKAIGLGWRKFGYIVYAFVTAILALLVISTSSSEGYFEPYNETDNVKVKDEPYVFLIIVDTLRHDWLSPYGYNINTPNIQNLCDDGILYQNMFSQCSWTRPSIASIMTSLYPSQHGVESFIDILNPNSKTLALSLRRAGYYTVGFCNNPHLLAANNFNIGFNYYKYLAPLELLPVDDNAPTLDFVNYLGRFAKRRFLQFYPEKAVKFYYHDAIDVTNKVIDWVSKNEDKKFFMFIHYMDPHGPYFKHPYNGEYYKPPTNWRESNYSPDTMEYAAGLYREDVEYLDKGIGVLFDYLKNQGIYDNSLIILTADHGEEFYDHKGATHGRTLYEEMTHVPLILKLPHSEKRGTVDKHLVQSVDIAPTAANFVGAEFFKDWQGKDIFSNGITNWSIAQLKKAGLRPTAIRNLKEKLYITYNTDKTLPPVGYYDIIKDPKEQHNLAADSSYRGKIKALEDTLNYLNSILSAKGTQAMQRELDSTTKERLKALGYIEG